MNVKTYSVFFAILLSLVSRTAAASDTTPSELSILFDYILSHTPQCSAVESNSGVTKKLYPGETEGYQIKISPSCQKVNIIDQTQPDPLSTNVVKTLLNFKKQAVQYTQKKIPNEKELDSIDTANCFNTSKNKQFCMDHLNAVHNILNDLFSRFSDPEDQNFIFCTAALVSVFNVYLKKTN